MIPVTSETIEALMRLQDIVSVHSIEYGMAREFGKKPCTQKRLNLFAAFDKWLYNLQQAREKNLPFEKFTCI